MNAVETVFGVIVLLLASGSVVLSLLVLLVWLWSQLRRLVARNRPPTVEQEYRALSERQ
jgi:hypothetical protein